MEKSIQLISELNQAFNDFFNSTTDLKNDKNKLIYQEANFKSSDVKDKDNVILVYPNITRNERASIGTTYESRTLVLYALRLYTNKNSGNNEHQKLISLLLPFFKAANPSSGYKSGDTLITGGVIIPDLKEWIISTLSSEFTASEQAKLD